MRNLKNVTKIILAVLIINFVLSFTNIYSVRAEEVNNNPEQTNEGEVNNNEGNSEGENQQEVDNGAEGENINPEENPLEGIDLSGAQGVEGLLGGETGEGGVVEGPKNIIERVDITAHLNHDGSASMTEVWNTNMITGTELTRIYTEFSSYKVSELSVVDETTGRQYTYIEDWNANTDKAFRDDKCGIVDMGNLVNICWGIGEYGRHKYIVRYKIADFVKDYSGYQLVYLKILQDNMDPAPRKSKNNDIF